jgi:subtilase family serine protease
VGRMDPGVRLSGMSLLFRMSPAQSTLQKYALAAVQDPASRSYHHWMTPEQCAVEFGAGEQDIARASSWLSSQGLSVDGPSRTATRLAFSGTIAQIEQAFHTEMHWYRVRGATHFAMSRIPSVPSDLANLVRGVRGLHDFRSARPSRGARPQYDLPIPQPDGGALHFPILAPADFAKIYDVESLQTSGVTGAGQTIAALELSDFNDEDIATFRSTFGLPNTLPTRVLVPNTGAAVVLSAAYFETVLDLEWMGAVAPGANLLSVFVGDAQNMNEIDPLLYAIEQRAASVLTMSYASCEDWHTPVDAEFLEDYAAIAALEGMTVVVAAGDTGPAECDTESDLAATHGKSVAFPSSVPGFVAAGGSQFQLTASNQSSYLDSQLNATQYIPESAWNETLYDIDAGYGGLGAGGGGASRLFAKPYWQVPYTPADGVRDVPDIALSASADILPYAVYMSWTAADGDAQPPQPEALTAYSGTSAAAPAFAGVLALVNQAVAGANSGAPTGLGNVNPLLYAFANAPASMAFHDITTGDNIVPCQPGSPDCPASPPYQFGYAAGAGYDQATGLGSIDAAKLVAAWSSKSPTSTSLHVSASGPNAGSSLQLTASVASGATTSEMTGSVTFYFVASADGGAGLGGTLGVATITPSTSSATEDGTATLTASAPGGLGGSGVHVGASYGGDPHYLASWSALSPVSGSSALAVCPTALTLAAGQTGVTFTSTGGSPPVSWGLHDDSTCVKESQHIACSSIDGGTFTAGPNAGSVTVVAIDHDDSYATAVVTVRGDGADGSVPPLPTFTCSFDAGDASPIDAAESTADASIGSGEDAADDALVSDGPGGDAMQDAQALDAPRESAGGSSGGGCSCSAGGAAHAADGWQGGALLVLLVVSRGLSRRHPHRRGYHRLHTWTS